MRSSLASLLSAACLTFGLAATGSAEPATAESASTDSPAAASTAAASTTEAPPAESAATKAGKADSAEGDAEPEEKTVPLVVADGDLTLAVPESWKQVKPRNRIIEAEISVPGKTKDDPTGRLTIMPSGGSLEANLARWAGQFRPGAAGQNPEPEIDEETVGTMKLIVFDASGTFVDSPRGPFGPKVEKPKHRMLAGILQTGDVGNYFFKLVGPAELVERHNKAFRKMLMTIEKSKSDDQP